MAREPKAILCPYCGLMQPQPSSDASASAAPRCSACGGLFDPLSRKATQIAMGPWYLRDRANPFRPGCCWEVLKRQIEAGRIKPTTVVRGPTTRQFWAIARNVPGVGHLLGYCHRCGAKVSKTDVACPECAEPFIEPDERNELGLVYASKAAAEAAYKQLEKEIDGEGSATAGAAAGGGAATSEKSVSPGKAAGKDKPAKAKSADTWQPGLDLLDEVIGSGGAAAAAKPVAAAAPELSAGRRKLAALSDSPGRAARLGAPLDFGPSDAEQAASEPAVAQGVPSPYLTPPRNSQLIVWLLVAINLLLLPILVGALLYFMGVFNSESSVAQPSPRSSLFDEPFDTPAPADSPPAAPAGSDAPEVMPVPRAQPRAQPPRAVTPPAPAPPSPSANVADAVATALADAARYEQAGDLTRALTLLLDVQQKTRPADRPAALAARIAELQEKIKRAEAAKFFGVPVGQ